MQCGGLVGLLLLLLLLLLLGLVGGLPARAPQRHCSSPSGSVDGRILVEEEGGATRDFTTITWQIGLGETLCYRSSSSPPSPCLVCLHLRRLSSQFSLFVFWPDGQPADTRDPSACQGLEYWMSGCRCVRLL
jgi:hypothetical protein